MSWTDLFLFVVGHIIALVGFLYAALIWGRSGRLPDQADHVNMLYCITMILFAMTLILISQT